MFSQEQIEGATAEELRKMITEVMAGYREARTAAAHHSLQYTLLCMESSEAIKRMEVEIDMKEKEVEVLQATRKASIMPATPQMSNQSVLRSSPSNDRIILDLKSACHLLEIENDNLQKRLEDAKAALIDREEALLDENALLRERIRANRNHISLLRRADSPETPSVPLLGTPYVTPAEPTLRRSRYAPVQSQAPSTPKQGHGDQFAALLLADRVLSQEESPASGPATRSAKTTSRSRQPAHAVPSIPVNKPLSGPYFESAHGLLQSPPMGLHTPTPRANAHRRRQSRDSTISASDLDEQQRELAAHHEVATPRPYGSRRANAVTSTPTPMKTPASARLNTSAQRNTPGANFGESVKRKPADVPQTGRTPKRTRLAEGVGLGISA